MKTAQKVFFDILQTINFLELFGTRLVGSLISCTSVFMQSPALFKLKKNVIFFSGILHGNNTSQTKKARTSMRGPNSKSGYCIVT